MEDVGSVELHPWISCLSLSVGTLCQIVFSKAVIVESSDDSCAVAVWLMKRSAMCEDNLCVCSLFMWHRRGMFCDEFLEIQGCRCGNAAIFAICDITTWPQALSQCKFLQDETFVGGC